jgi:hypothetical protein
VELGGAQVDPGRLRGSIQDARRHPVDQLDESGVHDLDLVPRHRDLSERTSYRSEDREVNRVRAFFRDGDVFETGIP